MLSQPGLTAFIMDEALSELIMGTNPGAAAKLYATTHSHAHTHAMAVGNVLCSLTPAIGARTQVGVGLQAARFYASIGKDNILHGHSTHQMSILMSVASMWAR
jgi:hypothetical protein